MHEHADDHAEVDELRFDEYVRAHGWCYRVRPNTDEAGGFFMAMKVGFPRAQLSAVVTALERTPREAA